MELLDLIFMNGVHKTWFSRKWQAELFAWAVSLIGFSVHLEDLVDCLGLLSGVNKDSEKIKRLYLRIQYRCF